MTVNFLTPINAPSYVGAPLLAIVNDFSRQQRVLGSADEVQLIARANATQTANLLEAQDSTGAALAVISGSGRLGLGTDAPATLIDLLGTIGLFRATRVAVDSLAGAFTFQKAGGAIGALTAVGPTASIAVIQFAGYDGANYQSRANIQVLVDGSVSAGVVPMAIRFSTLPNNSPTERGRITSAGVWVFGTGEASGTVTGTTLRGPAAVGSNRAGADLTIESGNGTGTGGSGAIIFNAAPVAASSGTANTLVQRFKIDKNGIAFYTATPVAQATLAANASDLATAITLVNDIKAKLSQAAGGVGLVA